MAGTESDVVAITQLVNLYGLAVDSQQWHLFDSMFTTNIDADYGATSRSDLEQFKSDFAAYHDPFDSTEHTMSTHVIHVDGDRAHSFCNGGWRLVRRPPTATPSGTAPAGMTTPVCARPPAGGSAAGYAASPGGPVTLSSTKRSRE